MAVWVYLKLTIVGVECIFLSHRIRMNSMKPYFHFFRSITLLFPVAVLSACSSDSTTVQMGDNSELFKPCADVSGMDCGVFEVPLIHDSTDNRQISIEVARLPGTGDGPHEPLLLNLGGPGSGVEVVRELTQSGMVPTAIRERYDIIGFDQRGVGGNLQIDCDHLGNAESIPYPRDQRDVMTLVADFTMLANSCSAEYTDQLQWVGSNAVVQDMEIMRLRLNAPKLNIIGSSFGTRITALYLERFPGTSGRIILDAPLAPNGKIDTVLLETTDAQQSSFAEMLNACGSVVPDCDRASVESAFVSRVNTLLDDRDLNTFSAFSNLISIAVEESDLGELLAPLLIDYAISGDPADMLALIQDFGLDQDGDGMDRFTLERAVVCADDAERPSEESLLTKLGTLNESSDFFAEALMGIAATCVGWTEALQPVTDIRAVNTPASLVIGGTGDVRTPISLAVETADAIGGVFLSSSHQGHGTLFSRENDCVDAIVLEFLLESTLPPVGTSCN